jgi:monoamine oxidase
MATEVLIIGAGAAGLAAACDLSAAGLSVLVVEARSRIGGRIFTQHEADESLPIELGAEFIHGKSPELFSIIKKADLKFEEVTASHWFFDNGHLAKSRDFWSAVEQLMSEMKGEVTDQSFKTYLTSRNVRAGVKAMASAYVEGFHAAQPDKVGIHGLTEANEASDLIDGHRAFRLLDGYASVAEVLMDEACKRGAEFRLNTTVTELRWAKNKVEALCQPTDGAALSAHKALITIPLSVLKLERAEIGTIKFAPSLPQWKLNAIRSLEMGSALRIVCRFTHRFWEDLELPGAEREDLKQLGFIHCPDAPLATWWTTLPEHEPILVGWAGGPKAQHLLSFSDAEVESRALESLSRIFGVNENLLRTFLAQSYFHNWQTDPLSRGAYSYAPVNGVEYQLNLAKQVDATLFFAGEATSLGHFGTVHGAVQSGKRAAREILTATSRS